MYKLTLRIDGDISLEAFREAIANFFRLLREVDEVVSGTRSVRWILADWRKGSPTVMTWVGEPRLMPKKKVPSRDYSPAVGEAVISGVEKLERGEGRPPEFSDDALEAMKHLVQLKVRRRGITGLSISGQNADRTKPSKALALTERVAASVDEIMGPKHTAIGSVEGILQVISSRGALHFAIYDRVWGGRVKCEIPEQLKSRALAVFDQRVLVHGIVSTDAAGHPRHVKVQDIEELPGRERLPQSLKGIDPDYTAGMDVAEYVKKRWAGDA